MLYIDVWVVLNGCGLMTPLLYRYFDSVGMFHTCTMSVSYTHLICQSIFYITNWNPKDVGHRMR